MDNIKKKCSGMFLAHYHGGVRSVTRNVCVHSTEGDTARGAASWFANPASRGSAHLVVDTIECYKTLPDLTVAYAAPGLNDVGWHLELAGHAAWTRVEWIAKKAELHRAAYKTALRCHKYDIPVRYVGPVGLRMRRKGITTHRAVSYAWPVLARKAGFHTDPGAGFPMDIFLTLVRDYLRAIPDGVGDPHGV